MGERKMSEQEIADFVAALDAISSDDPEAAHGDADDILLQCVPPEVRDAWLRLNEGTVFWYS